MKNFLPSWNEEKIRQVFSNFGLINSVYVKEEELKIESKDGGEPQVVTRKFAFVCFLDPNNKDAGFISAERAV